MKTIFEFFKIQKLFLYSLFNLCENKYYNTCRLELKSRFDTKGRDGQDRQDR